MKAWRTDNSRTAINVPFQHGKSLLSSIYFPAWVLLLWPETRVGLASYEEGFAAGFGGKVRDIINAYGPAFGVRVKDDTAAKGEWAIEGHGGGMVCKGRGGAFIGRPVDLLLLDDLIKNAIEAQSPTILEGMWDWFNTVAYSRLGPRAPIISVGTRWGPKDWFARVQAEEKLGGDKYTFIKFNAIAKDGDLLGRKEGAALWPERVPLARLERIQKQEPRWFKACWQQEPEEALGLHFRPSEWPRYNDTGDAWQIRTGVNWQHYRKVECTILIAVDWAQAGKKKSNKTAFVVGALTPDGRLFILDVFNKRLRYEENALELDRWCQRYSECHGMALYQVVASDDDMLSDAEVIDCRRYKNIPEIKTLRIGSRNKLIRAQAAIIRSQNNLFLLPSKTEPWYTEFEDQLKAFTGEEGAEDDIADCVGILGRLADEYKSGEERDSEDYVQGTSGYGMERLERW